MMPLKAEKYRNRGKERGIAKHQKNDFCSLLVPWLTVGTPLSSINLILMNLDANPTVMSFPVQ